MQMTKLTVEPWILVKPTVTPFSSYRLKISLPGKGENYDPSFLRLNPKGAAILSVNIRISGIDDWKPQQPYLHW